MGPPLPAWRTAVLLLCCGLFPGCTEETPVDGFYALGNAIASGDEEAAWMRFDRASRRMLEDRAAAYGKAAARTQLFGAGSRAFAVGIAHIRQGAKEGDDVWIELEDVGGSQARMRMRYEDGKWRVHIEGSDPVGKKVALRANANGSTPASVPKISEVAKASAP